MDLWWRKWLALSHRCRQPFFVGFAGRDERGSIEGENLPGTAKTSRPCSSAKLVVIRAPLGCRASVMSTPSERPEMMRLRAGKFPPSGLPIQRNLHSL